MIIDDIIFVFIIFVVVVIICIAVVRVSNNNNTDGNVHFAVDYNNSIKFKNLPTGGNQGLLPLVAAAHSPLRFITGEYT